MAPSTLSTPHHPFRSDQSWESQLACLFGIIGFALIYPLLCYLYNVVVVCNIVDSADIGAFPK